MIFTRTPFRISFAGGGSDLPDFYTRHEGCVLSTSINKYMYISIHPTFDEKKTVIKYNKTEIVDDIRKIEHPIARQLLIDFKISGVEINSVADVPSGMGLSTSSSYTVGLINALNAYKGKYNSQKRMAEKACELEIEKLGEPIGKQDQYGVAVGGMKFIRFLPSGRVEVEPIVVKNSVIKNLDESLLLFYVGMEHIAGEILKQQQTNVRENEEKFKNTIKMTEIAWEMRDALVLGDMEQFGKLMSSNWELKRGLSDKISNPVIEKYYNIAMSNGALGGKLLGAGGGGFLLFYCPLNKQMRLRAALHELMELDFKIEYSGTQVVYVGDSIFN